MVAMQRLIMAFGGRFGYVTGPWRVCGSCNPSTTGNLMAMSLTRYALILGLLAAVGPFAIDMYLPAMPAIAADLATSPQAVQATIIAYFIAFGLAQLIFGPWADQAGRKLPMTAGLVIFIAGSVICAVAPSVEWLIAGRAVQGFGGAAVMVIPRAVIRDLATGHEATRMMAAIMIVISISPMLAPLAGSGLMAVAAWRAIFWALMIAAAVSLVLTRFALPETLRAADRVPFQAAAMRAGFAKLMRDRGFVVLTFLAGFAMASFFVFIASAAFVYTEEFGLSPVQFSLAFALNALGFFGASQFASGLGRKHGALQVVGLATTGFAACSVALFAVSAAGFASLPLTMAGLFLGNAFLGLVIPTCMVLALDDHGDHAGLAASLGGTLQMLTGGVMIALAGPFLDGTVLPMLATIALCAALAFGLSRMIPRQAAIA
jgi:MFS transporter, DHA1 family, multidrug resistance protein